MPQGDDQDVEARAQKEARAKRLKRFMEDDGTDADARLAKGMAIAARVVAERQAAAPPQENIQELFEQAVAGDDGALARLVKTMEGLEMPAESIEAQRNVVLAERANAKK